MPIDIAWHIEGQIVLATITGVSDGDDLRKGQSIIAPWMDETSAQMVHVLFDCTAMERIAFSVTQELTTLGYLRHPKMGGFIVVGLPSTQRAIVTLMGGMISRMTRAKFHTAKDITSAMALIKTLDSHFAETSSPNDTPNSAL